MKKKKRLFVIYGIINLFITNIILQISLLIIPTIYATFLSQLFNFSFGFYFYGKKVFRINSFNRFHFIKYMIQNILIWNLNWIFISYLNIFGFSKNIIALIIIPFLAILSYIFQRYFVFLK